MNFSIERNLNNSILSIEKCLIVLVSTYWWKQLVQGILFQDWDGKGKYNKSTFYSMYKSQYYTTYYTFLSILSSYYKSWNDAVIKYKVFTMV